MQNTFWRSKEYGATVCEQFFARLKFVAAWFHWFWSLGINMSNINKNITISW
jgi:hypothetical protein